MKNLFLIFLSAFLFLFSCRKEGFITSPDARVVLSEDSLYFDTLFTSTGSVTHYFKIFNDNDQKLRISSVKLMGGSNSFFRINADGFIGPQVNNLEVDAKDSLYVFVTVTINPGAGNIPFVVRDSIEISYNGKNQQVQLEAWGQNAHFFRNKRISADETWNNDRPYVILGSLIIDPDKTLTINKGCRIYVHADAPIIVDGTLLTYGQKDTVDHISFQGDRLDEPYNGFPGGWPGIYFRATSKNSVLNFTDIKNGYQSIALLDPSVNSNPKLTMNECVVDNSYDAGIIAINSSLRAKNCQLSNCGKNLVLVKGGDYQLTHCTVASISNSYIFHKEPVLFLSNFVLVNNSPVTANLNAVFRNCIFWGENGTVDNEVVVKKSGSTVFNVNFDANLWKVQTTPSDITSSQIINNQNPAFDSINVAKRYYNFRLKNSSPAINKGTNAGVTIDLDGKPRPVGLPDPGSFEKQ
jgi:hypothetical protein